MNLTTIEVSAEEAEAKLAEYETALKTERNAQDEALAQAYRAAKRGQPIIRLSEAITAGGCFDNGLPRIAIARATATQCFLSTEINHDPDKRTLVFSEESWPRSRAKVGTDAVRVEVPIVANERMPWRASTVVPSIPPSHRPKRARLRRYHILWEVETWTKVIAKDPALLRHLRGDLWTVLSTWDLTELERAVLSR